MKVVINTCYGGFGLSNEAVMRFAELKSITLYESEIYPGLSMFSTVSREVYEKLSLEDRNAAYFSVSAIDRTDPHLIQVLKELGKKANGPFANLEIIEIPDDTEWTVEEYDGREWIAEKHRTWGYANL